MSCLQVKNSHHGTRFKNNCRQQCCGWTSVQGHNAGVGDTIFVPQSSGVRQRTSQFNFSFTYKLRIFCYRLDATLLFPVWISCWRSITLLTWSFSNRVRVRVRVLQIDRNKSGRLDGINLLCRDFVEEIIVSYKVTTFLGRTNLEYTGIARNQSQNSFDSPPAISIVDSLSHRRPSDRHKIMQNKRLGLGQRGGEASNNESALSEHKKLADFSQGYSGKKKCSFNILKK